MTHHPSVPGEAATESPLIGRELEQRQLLALFEGALRGRGAVVLLSGEAGIGKTALVHDLVNQAVEREVLALSGCCYDTGISAAYSLWQDLLSDAARRSTRVAIPLVDDHLLTDAQTADAVHTILEQRLKTLSGLGPLLIILEDIHWADPESLTFLRLFARHLQQQAVLLVATYRDTDLASNAMLDRTVPSLVREANAERITLHSLDESAIAALVRQRYDLLPADQARLTTSLVGRSQGVPFYVVELLRTFEDEQSLRRTADGWALGELDPQLVPGLVKQVIETRLHGIGNEARRLLELAAVIGQEIPLMRLRRLSGLDEDTFVEKLDEALSSHMLVSGPTSLHAQFSHALVRDSLYTGISLTRRQRWHRQIAEVLAERGDSQPDVVAHHFRRALDRRAVEWFIRAGTEVERVAWLTAAAHFGAALEMMGTHDVNPGERGWLLIRRANLLRPSEPYTALAILNAAESMAVNANDLVLQSYVTFSRGQIRCVSGEMKAGMADLKAGVAALMDLPSHDLERVEQLERQGVVMKRAEIDGILASMLATVGNITKALECARTIIERAKGVPIWAWAARGVALSLAGEPEAARTAFLICQGALRSISDESTSAMLFLIEISLVQIPYGADDLVERRRVGTEGETTWLRSSGSLGDLSARMARVPELLLEGSWSEAYEVMLNGVQSSDFTSTKYLFASVHLGYLARWRGEVSLAWQQIWRMLPAGPETFPGYADLWPSLAIVRLAATLCLDAGEPTTARAWLELHDRWLDWSGAILGRADGQLLWAQLHRQIGDRAQAQKYAGQAFSEASTPRQPLVLLAAHRLLGELETQFGRFTEARQELQRALDLAEACAASYEYGLTLLAYADLDFHAGKADAALDALNTARLIFARLNATPALARAEELATQFAGEHGTEPAPTFGLSPRETEVLRLIANGARNREIANELSLSERTVERHISNLYAKVNVSGRSEAIAFAHANHIR